MDLCGEWSLMEFSLFLWWGSVNLFVVGLTIFVGIQFVVVVTLSCGVGRRSWKWNILILLALESTSLTITDCLKIDGGDKAFRFVALWRGSNNWEVAREGRGVAEGAYHPFLWLPAEGAYHPSLWLPQTMMDRNLATDGIKVRKIW